MPIDNNNNDTQKGSDFLHRMTMNALAGFGAGFTTGFVIGPAETLKVFQQVSHDHHFRDYFSERFRRIFVKTTPPFAVSFGFTCALEFTVVKMVGETYGSVAGVFASALAGASFLTVADHYTCLHTKEGMTLSAFFKHFQKQPHLAWTGATPMVGRELIYIISAMHAGPYVGKQLHQKLQPSDHRKDWRTEYAWPAVGTFLTGLVTTVTSQPFDAWTREMQKQLASNPRRKLSFFDVVRKTPPEQLLKGMVPRVALASTGATLAVACFKYFNRKLDEASNIVAQQSPPKSSNP